MQSRSFPFPITYPFLGKLWLLIVHFHFSSFLFHFLPFRFPKKERVGSQRGEKKPTTRPKKRFYFYILPIE
ncbi:MAG: hypothetical protein UHW86_06295, partial [Spirochaetota bacterium]|nr:hypothetical protein [Spirochaetota bacterium]